MAKKDWNAAELAALLQHVAVSRPASLGTLLWALTASPAVRCFREAAPDPGSVADLAAFGATARALVRSSPRGRQLLEAAPTADAESPRERLRRQAKRLESALLGAALDEATRPAVERTCRAAITLAATTLALQEADAELTRGLAELLGSGQVSVDAVTRLLGGDDTRDST